MISFSLTNKGSRARRPAADTFVLAFVILGTLVWSARAGAQIIPVSQERQVCLYLNAGFDECLESDQYTSAAPGFGDFYHSTGLVIAECGQNIANGGVFQSSYLGPGLHVWARAGIVTSAGLGETSGFSGANATSLTSFSFRVARPCRFTFVATAAHPLQPGNIQTPAGFAYVGFGSLTINADEPPASTYIVSPAYAALFGVPSTVSFSGILQPGVEYSFHADCGGPVSGSPTAFRTSKLAYYNLNLTIEPAAIPRLGCSSAKPDEDCSAGENEAALVAH